MNAGNMAGNQQFEFGQQGQNVQQKSIEVYAQSLAQQQRTALNNHAMVQGMSAGVQGSPMNAQSLDGQEAIFAGNPPRPAMPAGAPGQPQQGNHALQDYQMQLMLLEQQNKKRLLMARQEQDSMSTGPHQPAVGAPGFPPAMSPQGSRAGPSPNPTDQMKRGTPKLDQRDLPGSPMPGVQQRSSPAPGMNFDPSQMPPGMPPQFPGYNQMPQNPMMRPPSSHPNFNGQQLTPQQQMEMMRQNGGMPNGGPWRGAPGGPQGMVQGQGQQMGGPVNNPQQRNQMPPPPAPPAGEQPRTQEPSPSQSAQAPPTPNQSNKANPKKKPTKNDKVTLCASYILLSIVDIDCRSPQKRKGQIQVRLQQRQVKNLHQHRHLRLPLRPCTKTRSPRMDSNRLNLKLNPSPPPLPSHHLLWITVLRLAVSAMM